MKNVFTKYISMCTVMMLMIGCMFTAQAQRTVTFSGVNTNFVTGSNVTVTRVSTSQSSQSIPCINASNLSYVSNNSSTGYVRFDLALSTEKIDSIRVIWKSGADGQVLPVVWGESIVVGTYLSVSNVVQATNGGFVASKPIALAAGTNCTGGDTLRFPSTSTVRQILIPRCINYNAGTYSSATQYSLFPSRLNNGTTTGYTTALNSPTTSFIGLVTLYISNIVTCAAPTFSAHPSTSAQSLCPGASATALTVTASGSGTLSYQWKSSTAADFSANVTNVGTNSNSYTPSTATPGILYYRCVVTNDCGGGSTNTATSNMSGAVTIKAAPSISSQSTAGATYGEGASASPLTITAAGAGLSYQWYSSTDAASNTAGDDAAVGTNSNSYAPSTAAQGTLYYYCVVSGDCTPSVTSAVSGAINVVPACTAPQFIDQPLDFQVNCAGEQVSIGTVTTDIPASFQWYTTATKTNTGGTPVTSGTGGTTDTYIPPFNTPGTFYYYCIASSGACSTASEAIEVTFDATAITGQSTAAATYSLNATASAMTVTASGFDLAYQWYSNTTASNTGGTIIDGATGDTYTPLTTSLGTKYYYCVVTGFCSPTTVTSAVSGAIQVVQFATGDYKSVATGNWGTNTTWQKWNGSSWAATASGDFPNATTASVYIEGGFTVNVETSGRNIKNLFISGNSTLKSSNLVNSPSYLRINGATISVESGSLIGNLATGNNTDGISLDVFSTDLTVTGNGGTINLSRIRTNTAGTTVTIDNNVTLNYHGSGNAGNAAGYYTAAGSNNILTINAGKTLTFAPWSCYTPVSSSHTNSNLNQIINVNGTLTMVDGLVPGNATANGWSGHTNGYFSFGATAGTTFILNIGSTGIMNVSEFYPNGTQNSNAAGTGTTTSINIAAGGALNVSKIADFRNATQTVTGGGTFSIAAAGVMRIGAAAGISAADATGNIQTATRSFSSAADYAYEGTAAQVTGDGLPATVNNLTINNSNGVTLTATVAVNGTLTFTNGKLTTGTNKVAVTTAGNSITGTTSARYVNGNLERAVAAGASTVSFPIGDAANYTPVSLAFGTENTAGNVTASTAVPGAPAPAGAVPSGSGLNQTKYINRSWTLTADISSPDYAATFTYVAGDVTGGANTNALLVAKNSGGVWSQPTVATSVSPSVSTVGGQSSFSTFYLGEEPCLDVNLVSASATTNPVCGAATTTMTATGLSGNSAVVNWWTGTNGTGTNVGTGLTSNAVGAGTYYARATGECGTPVEIQVVITAAANTFTGTGNWTDGSKWSCGSAPASGDAFTIDGSATLNTSFTVAGSMSIGNSGTLTVAPNNTLTVSGSANFNNRLVTFKSDATGYGSLGQVTGTISNAGNVTVERYIPNNGFRSWRLLSVPTFGTQTIKAAWQEGQSPLVVGTPGLGTLITGPGGGNGLDGAATSASLLRWNGTGWTGISSTNATLSTFKAYFMYIRGDRTKGITGLTTDANATTLRSNGSIYTGDQNFTVSANAFQLVGNLYPSAIDFTQLGGLSNDNGVTGVARTFYIWDSKKLNGTSLGVYQTFSATNGYDCLVSGGSFTLGQPNTTIESGQGFLVQGGTGSGGTLTLKEAAKISGTNGNLGFRPSTTKRKINTRLYNSDNELVDANLVVFDAAYSETVAGEDALKFTNPGANLAIEKNGHTLAVEGTTPVKENDVIQYRMWNLQPGTYTLELAAVNMAAISEGLAATLEDSYLKTSTAINLESSTAATFTVDGNAGSSDANRFRIVFSKAKPVIVPDTKQGYSIAPNPVENGVMNLVFHNQKAGKYTVRVIGVQGQSLLVQTVSHNGGSAVQRVSLPAAISSGTYKVEVIAPDKTRTLQSAVVNK